MKRLLGLLLAWLGISLTSAADFRGGQLMAFDRFEGFVADGSVLTSPVLAPAVEWDELIVSWNMTPAWEGHVRVEARAIFPEGPTKFYALGVWSTGPEHRQSVTNQADADGEVQTDVLKMKRRGAKVEVRVIFQGGSMPTDLKFLGLCFSDSAARAEPLEANRRAWGKTIPVRPRSQLDFPEGARIWCSPTSTSMILDYWSQQLQRPEMSLPVPAAAAAVHDPNWPGTGNWPFNTAWAGGFAGMRGYVTRLADVSELEDWIEAGAPVATSVSYNRLKGKGVAGSGHLVVCVGFTEHGDVVVNDPGTELANVRRTFAREVFRQAWADSGNTVYLIHPATVAAPVPRHGRWEQRR